MLDKLEEHEIKNLISFFFLKSQAELYRFKHGLRVKLFTLPNVNGLIDMFTSIITNRLLQLIYNSRINNLVPATINTLYTFVHVYRDGILCDLFKESFP